MSIPAIILAAGASRRLGRPKQLIEVSGEHLLRRTTLAVLTGCMPVIVVLGSQADKIGRSLSGLPITIIVNNDWEEGIASSIRAGIRALPVNAGGVFLFVCDQIAMNSGVVARLLETQARCSESIIACEYSGIRGTPAYFPAKYFHKLKALSGNCGAGKFLQEGPIARVSFPEGSYDVDYPEDLSKYLTSNIF